jgi:manganese oxidase
MLPVVIAVLGIASYGAPTGAARVAADCRHLPTPPTRQAIPNDNRARAGTLRDGVLTVRLVAHSVAWRPDGDAGCALTVNAFAEEGRLVQVPGPLMRVRAGTEVRVSVRNALDTTLWVRGLQDRTDGTPFDSTEIAPGATHDFQFVAKTRGAWFYWAGRSTARTVSSNADGQLVGALVVDAARDDGSPPPADRVLVLTRWSPTGTLSDQGFQLNAFNGRSWPKTERLTYTVGDSVRWQVINASNGLHEMHLHGFFFRIDARGYDIDSAAVAAAARARGLNGIMRVTSVLRPGEWISLVWSPDRPGNWLYHCHLLSHMTGAQRLDRMPEAGAPNGAHRHGSASDNHATHDMGGLVMALDVRPKAGERAAGAPTTSSAPPTRTIALFANRRPGRFGDHDGYGFVAQEGPRAPAPDSILIPGTPLVLTKGEPVRITVHNRLTVAISVHWHGIELDSYFDGVGGFSGAGTRIAPVIAPNDSFVVRFTPPRAGTYMYHVHGETGEELASGLYAPLLVLEPGKAFDPRTDRTFVFADGGPGVDKPIFVNGTASPDTTELVAGTSYRFRMIYIAANDVYLTTVRDSAGLVMGRQVALDGHDVPFRPVDRPMRFPTGPGHTLDFVFTPQAPGDYALDVQRNGIGVPSGPVTTAPIRVRAP